MLEITDRYLILLLQSYNSLIIILILIYLFFVQTNPDWHAHMCCVQKKYLRVGTRRAGNNK